MALINENDLKKHIKTRHFSSVYLIYGAEKMFVSKYTDKLVKAVVGKTPSDFNFHTFEGNVDLDTLSAALQVVPFMSEYNCVLIKDLAIDDLRKDEYEKLKDIIKSTGEGTVFIMSMPTYEQKPSKSKSDEGTDSKKVSFSTFVKFITKYASVCEFAKLNQSMLERYIAKWANENGKLISHINASKLINYCGEDLNLLRNETDKVCAYSAGEEVTLEAIEKLATVNNVEVKVFAMTDAVLNGNAQQAFNSLNLLVRQGSEPILTFAALSSTFVDAYRIRVADECGVMQNTIVADFPTYNRKAFVLGKARTATRFISTDALRQCVDVLMEADVQMKTNMKDAKNTFQQFMEQLISKLLLIAKEGRV